MPIQQLTEEVHKLVEQHQRLVMAQEEQAHAVRDLTAQVTRMNGRLGKLETAEFDRQIGDAEQRGRSQAAGDAILTKGTVAKLSAVLSVASVAGGILSRFVA